MNDRNHDEESVGTEGQQDNNPPSKMGEGSISKDRNGADLNSDRESSTNDSPEANEHSTDRPDVQGSSDADRENYARARETTARELRSLADALESGDAILVEARGNELMTKGKGKQPPQKTGIWILQILYKRGIKLDGC